MSTGVTVARSVGHPIAATRKGPSKRTGLLLAAILISMASGYLGYQRYTAGNHVSAPTVNTTQARVGSLVSTVSSTGSVVAVRQAKLGFSASSSASGKLAELNVNFGDSVKAGQLLAKLDPLPFQVAVDTAQSALNTAKIDLQALMNGSTADEIASAQAGYTAALAKHNSVAAGTTAADMASAQASVDQALASQALAQLKLDQLKNNTYTQSDWAAAQAAVDTATSSIKNAQAKLAEVKQGSTQAELAAQQAAVNSAKQALTSAEDRYETARGSDSSGNSTLAASGFSSVSAAQQNYNAAKANYDAAVRKLQEMQAGPLPADLQAAQTTVDTAQANLRSAQAKLDLMKQGPLPSDLATSENSVEQARATIASAQAKLDQLKQGPTEADLSAALASVASAKAALADKANPPKESEVNRYQEAVNKAQVALDQARDNLSNATLVAPFDGVVSAVNGNVGEMTGSSAVVTLVDPTAVRIDGTVGETDLAKIAVGQKTMVTFDALTGQQFQGKVAAIAPVGTTSQGVVNYQVSVSLDNPGRTLPAGMSASLSIITEQKDNVLLVPVKALHTSGNTKTVEVMVGEKTESRPVQIGSSTDQLAEVISGLQPGETVVIPGTAAKTTTTSNMGGPGMGIPGVGGPPTR